MVIVLGLYSKNLVTFSYLKMLKLLVFLSSDALLYCVTFDMMYRYSWSVYCTISITQIQKIYSYVLNKITKINVLLSNICNMDRNDLPDMYAQA